MLVQYKNVIYAMILFVKKHIRRNIIDVRPPSLLFVFPLFVCTFNIFFFLSLFTFLCFTYTFQATHWFIAFILSFFFIFTILFSEFYLKWNFEIKMKKKYSLFSRVCSSNFSKIYFFSQFFSSVSYLVYKIMFELHTKTHQKSHTHTNEL